MKNEKVRHKFGELNFDEGSCSAVWPGWADIHHRRPKPGAPHYAALRVVTKMGGEPCLEGVALGREVERRFNSHEDLLAAAEDSLDVFDGLTDKAWQVYKGFERKKRLMAAIAKAKGDR